MLVIGHINLTSQDAASVLKEFGTKDDRDYADRYRRQHRRHQSLYSRALLRYLISIKFPEIDCRAKIRQSKDGRPYFDLSGGRGEIDISLTHSHGMAAAAVSSMGAVGIDIEYVKQQRNFAAMAEHAFDLTAGEASTWADAGRFYSLWSVVECLVKANILADGAAVEPDKFEALSEDSLYCLTLGAKVAMIGHKDLGSYAMGLAINLAPEFPVATNSSTWPTPQPNDRSVTIYEISS